MTKDFLLLIRLFSFSAKGESVSDEVLEEFFSKDKGLDVEKLRRVYSAAMIQNCSAMTDIAFQDILVKSGYQDEASRYLKRIKLQIMSSSAVSGQIHELVTQLEKKGIQTKILKGMSLSSLYAIPECRTSCDTDILIPKNKENSAYEVMRGLGYKIAPRTEYSHHATCTHPKAGTVELHTDLFFERITDVIFDKEDFNKKLSDSNSSFVINGLSFKTLGITENLIYITLHMIQHFIRSGTSIRQLYDLLIYCKRYKDEIDLKEYFSCLERFSYTGIYNVVMSCGVEYFGFKEDELMTFERLSKDVVDEFLTDIENGGWIGKRRDDGYAFFRAYGNLKAKNSNSLDEKQYKKELKKYQRKRMISSVFPDKERLIAKFPYAENPVLRPFAWFAWLGYGFSLLKQGELSSDVKDDDELSESDKKRFSLFEKLDMIDSEDR